MLLVCLKLLKNSLSGASGNGIIRGRDEGKGILKEAKFGETAELPAFA